MANTTLYEKLTNSVPKQVKDLEAQAELNSNIKIFSKFLNGIFYGPLAMYVTGFGSMEMVWVIHNNLQLISCIM
jgi:hypothetical protein